MDKLRSLHPTGYIKKWTWGKFPYYEYCQAAHQSLNRNNRAYVQSLFFCPKCERAYQKNTLREDGIEYQDHFNHTPSYHKQKVCMCCE